MVPDVVPTMNQTHVHLQVSGPPATTAGQTEDQMHGLRPLEPLSTDDPGLSLGNQRAARGLGSQSVAGKQSMT